MKLQITLNTLLLLLVFSTCRGFQLNKDILDDMVKNTAFGTSKLPGETGGMALNMKTDKVFKLISFETSLYRLSNLSRKVKTHPNASILKNPNKEEGKLGQASMSIKLPNAIKGLKGEIKVGKQTMKHGLLSETSSRKAPNSWNGYRGNLKWNNFNLSLAKVEKLSPRNEEGYKHITNFKGKPIKNILSTHAQYQTKVFDKSKLKIQYRDAISKHHVRSHNSDISLAIPLEQNLEARFGAKCYLARKAGHLWESEYRGKPIFSKKANAVNVMGVLSSESLEFEVGASHFQSDHQLVSKKGKIALPGSYYSNFGKNIRGTWDVDTRGFAQEMNYGGETVLMTGIGYKLIGLKNNNLRVNYSVRYGSNIGIIDSFNNKKKVSEYEHDFALFFTPGFKGIKGLNFALEYGLYHGAKELMQANNLKKDKLRVWLDYELLVF